MKVRNVTLLVVLLSAALQASLSGQTQIKKAGLDRLLEEAQRAHSSALVIWKDGQLNGEWYFGGHAHKIEAMSATKSVVSLAIGRLITEGKIKSLDQAVYEFYPEWKQGRKKDITLRHLLSHTSGLQNELFTHVEIYPSPDFVQLALAAELKNAPGTAFAYNNKAVNLLAGIVQKASGKRMDVYIGEEIFKPLGITDFSWSLDHAGNPHAMSGLQILPGDLAKIGQLVLDRGKWNGKQIISESWFDESLRASQPYEPRYGLLWWLGSYKATFIVDDGSIQELANRGAPADVIEKVRSLKGRYASYDACLQALLKAFGSMQELLLKLPDVTLTFVKKELGPITSYSAVGDLGQYLLIIPKGHLVLVRMAERTGNYNEKADGMLNIEELARSLIQ